MKYSDFEDSGYDDVITLGDAYTEKALLGISSDRRAVYDFDTLLELYVTEEGWTQDEAIEWIDINILGSKIDGKEPIIVFKDYIP